MVTQKSRFRPVQTIQKGLISTPSHLIGEYLRDDLAIMLAWPIGSTWRRGAMSTPVSRTDCVVAFSTPQEDLEGVILLPNYSAHADMIAAYMSLLFGKRFDFCGLVESIGSFQIPDFTTHSELLDPRLSFHSAKPRFTLPVPLLFSNFAAIDRRFFDEFVDVGLRTGLDSVCKFYMRALQNAEKSPEVAYLYLVTAGEVLADLARASLEVELDEQTRKDLDAIAGSTPGGKAIASRMKTKLRSIKRRFVKTLLSLLEDDFFESPPDDDNTFFHFSRDEIERNIGAAYDLRSRYLHTSIPSFGAWIQPHAAYSREDVPSGKPVHDHKEFARIIGKAPKLGGLERLIRYCALRYMESVDLLDLEKTRFGDDAHQQGVPAEPTENVTRDGQTQIT